MTLLVDGSLRRDLFLCTPTAGRPTSERGSEAWQFLKRAGVQEAPGLSDILRLLIGASLRTQTLRAGLVLSTLFMGVPFFWNMRFY